MRQQVKDALDASPLSEAGRRAIIAYCDERYSYALHPLHLGPIPADVLATAIADATKAEAGVATDPKAILKAALDACFYGTLQPREGSDRPGRAADGWRHGVSHPFKVLVKGQPQTVDFQPLPGRASALAMDVARDEYERLVTQIDAGQVTAAP